MPKSRRSYLVVPVLIVLCSLGAGMFLGGGVSAAFDLFAPRARAEMMRRAFPVPAQRCQILKAECGDDAGLLGAAWLALARA